MNLQQATYFFIVELSHLSFGLGIFATVSSCADIVHNGIVETLESEHLYFCFVFEGFSKKIQVAR